MKSVGSDWSSELGERNGLRDKCGDELMEYLLSVLLLLLNPSAEGLSFCISIPIYQAGEVRLMKSDSSRN